MPITIEQFNSQHSENVPSQTGERILEFLKSNKNFAYSTIDFMNELKLNYQYVTSALRWLRQTHSKNIEFKWYRGIQQKAVYFKYKENVNDGTERILEKA